MVRCQHSTELEVLGKHHVSTSHPRYGLALTVSSQPRERGEEMFDDIPAPRTEVLESQARAELSMSIACGRWEWARDSG